VTTAPSSTALESLSTLAPSAVAHEAVRPARKREWWAGACVATDAAMLFLAWLATDLGAVAANVPGVSIPAGLVFAAVALVSLHRRGLYAPALRLRTVDDVRSVVVASTLAAMVLIAGGAVVGLDQPVDEVLRLWAFAAVYAASGRAALYWSQARSRREGEGLKPTLILGAGRIGHLTAKRLLASPEFGLLPIGYLDKDPLTSLEDSDIPVLGASWDFDRIVEQHHVEQVIVAFSTAPNEVLLRVVKRCEELGIDIALVPRLYEKTTTHVQVDHLGGLPLLHLRASDPSSWQFMVKYAVDRILAAAALIATLPVVLAAGAAVWISMGRPIFFRQARVGLDGRNFDILKFRSMRLAESSLEIDDDVNRLTKVGAFLRRTSIDELPQLLNVLRGEMSLVGPRPERPELAGIFAGNVYRYGERHRVKSGITGWAQVHGLGRGPNRFANTSLSDRVEWDNYYIENWSLWLDVKIALMTVFAVLRFRQAD
jgi:exopolysaccharide biosynthesis polyprenyl glycosylphosphotransferase